MAVDLLRGGEAAQSWTLPRLEAGQSTAELDLTPEVWREVLLGGGEPLAVAAAGRTLPLYPPEPIVYLAAVLDAWPAATAALGLEAAATALAGTHRRWEQRALPMPACRDRARLFLDLALRGEWARLCGELAADPDTAGQALPPARWSTSFQCAAPLAPDFDVRPDAVLIYGLANTARRAREWQRAGYGTQLMTGIAWGS